MGLGLSFAAGLLREADAQSDRAYCTQLNPQVLINKIMIEHTDATEDGGYNLGQAYACPTQAVIEYMKNEYGSTQNLRLALDPFTEKEATGGYDIFMGDWSEYTDNGDLTECDTNYAMDYTDGTDTSGGAGGNGCNFAWWYSEGTDYGGPIAYTKESRHNTTGHGKITNAYWAWDGTSNYAVVDDNLSLNGDVFYNAMTMSMWFRTTYYDPDTNTIFSNWALFDFDRSEFFNVFVHPSGLTYFSSANYDGSTDQGISDTIEQGAESVAQHLNDWDEVQWHMVTAKFYYDGAGGADGVKSLYRNGALSDSNTGYVSIGNSDSRPRGLVIGDGSEMWNTARPINNGRNNVYFDGDIGLIMYWEAALSDADIVATYDLTKKFYQDCPQGKYCTAAYSYACSPGYYCTGNWQQTPCGGNQFYCPGGETQITPTNVTDGYYSTGGTETTRTGISICPQGYYCQRGVMIPCGGKSLYCPVGSTTPTVVSQGYYTSGYGDIDDQENTRTSQIQCSPGTWCKNGDYKPCPAGRYGESYGLYEDSCSGPCAAGFFCDNRSTSAYSEDCGKGPTPARWYCPEGTEARMDVNKLEELSYTTPVANKAKNRESYLSCTDDIVCINGTRHNAISWDADTDCAIGPSSKATMTFDENLIKRTKFGTPQTATFYEGKSTVTYSLDPSTPKLFEINETTGQLYFNGSGGYDKPTGTWYGRNYDYEDAGGVPSFSIRMLATSAANEEFGTAATTINCTVRATVADANDPPLIWNLHNRSVPENALLYDYIEEPLSKSDQDVTQDVFFSIIGGSPDVESIFGITSCGGQLYLNDDTALDYNTRKEYNVHLQGCDTGTPTECDYGNVTILVTDANDAPRFVIHDPSCSVYENSPINTTLMNSSKYDKQCIITAYDEDVSDTLTWSISRNSDNMFGIRPGTGVVYAAKSPDYEFLDAYTIEVTVADNAGVTDSIEVSISVLNLNEQVTLSYQTLYVDENSAEDTVVGSPTTYDVDADTTFTYRIVEDNSNGYFDIDKTTGEITVSATADLNYEAKKNYTLIVNVTDSGIPTSPSFKTSAVAEVVIIVEDVNEEPVLVRRQAFNVSESDPVSTKVGTIQYSDVDKTGTHIFSVVDSMMDSADTGYFDFSDPFVPKLHLVSSVDFESHSPEFILWVEVRDQGGLTDVARVNVTMMDANDIPYSPETQAFTVKENTVGKSMTLGYTDEDKNSVANPAWGRLYYAVSGSMSSYFNTTHVGQTPHYNANLSSTVSLNYEETSSFDLTVTATDGGGLLTETTVTVTVENQNDAPYFADCPTGGYGAAIKQTADRGQGVASIVATDEDAETLTEDDDVISWSTLTYTLSKLEIPDDLAVERTGGSGGGAPYFDIDEDTGTISKAFSGDFANDETFFRVVVNVTDGGGLKASCPVNINVTKANKSPIIANLSAAVRENVTGVVDIGTINVWDDQYGIILAIDSCTALPTESSCGTTRKSMFSIGDWTSDGVLIDDAGSPYDDMYLYTAPLRVNTSEYQPNYEDSIFDGNLPSTFVLGISATDVKTTAPLFSENEIKVSIIDVHEAPVLEDGSTNFDENTECSSAAPCLIVDLSAEVTDGDYDEDLKYNLTASTRAKYPGVFNLDRETGQLYAVESFDYEETNSYSLQLVVEDKWGLTDTAKFTIYVQNVDEAPNALDPQNFTISETASVGATVGTIRASAEDFGDTLSYAFANSDDDASSFKITTSGSIYLYATLDFETQAKYVFDTIITSSNGKNTTVKTIVNVDDANDLEVTSILTPAGSSELMTMGNETIVITGDNFGPSTAKLGYGKTKVDVSYWNEQDKGDGYMYHASDCRVTVANTEIRCTTAQGVGQTLYWNVTVAAQNTSVWTIVTKGSDVASVDKARTIYTKSDITTSYKAPAIVAMSNVTNLQTAGGQEVIMLATDLGPPEWDAATVYYGRSESASDVYECDSADVLSQVSNDSQYVLKCTTQAGYGDDLWWEVRVGINAKQVSDPFDDGYYKQPEVTDLYPRENFTTHGGEVVTITGTNFGEVGTPISATYGGVTGFKYTATDCEMKIGHTSIECRTAPGVGGNLTWRVSVDDRPSPTSDVKIKYTAPILSVTSGQTSAVYGKGAQNAGTEGGQTFTITGTEFGPLEEKAVVFKYGGSDADIFQASECYTIIAYTTIRCTSSEGTGKNHYGQLYIGGQASNVFPANMSYNSPKLGRYDPEWGSSGTGAVTRGGEWIELGGSDFGTVERNAIDSVTYGPTGFEFTSCDAAGSGDCLCRVVRDHNKINCTLVEGVGTDLVFKVVIDGQMSEYASFDYEVPSISAITGQGARNADHAGDELVTLSGANFGAPSSGFLDSVTYGPVTGKEYSPRGCIVKDHDEIVCNTTAGIGADLYWLVTVDGQVSDSMGTDSPTTFYAEPNITSMIVYDKLDAECPDVDEEYSDRCTYSTNGGARAYINGTNFGLAVPNAYTQVWLDGVPVAFDGNSLDKIYYAMVPNDYAWIDEHGKEHLMFIMPELSTENVDHSKKVTVEVGHQLISTTQSSNYTVYKYGEPVISDLQNSAVSGSSTMVDLYISGYNFGADGVVTIVTDAVNATGRTVTTYTAANTSKLNGYWTHNAIKFRYMARAGNVTVTVGDKVSNQESFNDFSPAVITTCKDYQPDENGYRTTGKTSDGSAKGVLTIAGIYFYSVESNLAIEVGGVDCPIKTGSLTTVTDTASCYSTDLTVRSIQCYVPEGTGKDNEIALIRNGQSSLSANATTDVLYLDYNDPEIFSVAPATFPTTGGYLTITGRNFGATASEATVTWGKTTLSVDRTFPYNHSFFVVQVPAGQGTAKTITVDVAGSTDTIKTDESFSYDPPVMLNLTIGKSNGGSRRRLLGAKVGGGTIPTSGASIFIRGSNLGGGTSTVKVLSKVTGKEKETTAEIVDQDTVNHKWMEVAIGEGEGRITLQLNSSGNIATADLNYTGPVINTSLPSQLTMSTQGGEMIELFGESFGSGSEDCEVVFSYQGVKKYSYRPNNVSVYNHTYIRFLSPEGEADGPMELKVVAGGLHSNVIMFNYSKPFVERIGYGVDRSSVCVKEYGKFCPDGGYAIKLQGENFGSSKADLSVIFGGKTYTTDDESDDGYAMVKRVSHTVVYFHMPSGVGKNIDLQLVVGSQAAPVVLYSYSAPVVAARSPNAALSPTDFNANGDVLTIYGYNFGYSGYKPSDEYVKVLVGGESCTAVASRIFQTDDNGYQYLWCQTAETTVGHKNLTIRVAEQTISYSEDESYLSAMCQIGWYGQGAWTSNISVSEDEGELVCGANEDIGKHPQCNDVEEACISKWDEFTGSYLNDEDGACTAYPNKPCQRFTSGNFSTNCTVITRYDEYCLECPLGSECDVDPSSSLYPVEPLGSSGYWRQELSADSDDCTHSCPSGEDCDDENPYHPRSLRKHRTSCYQFVPCSPAEACEGENKCAKGYTGTKCQACCDASIREAGYDKYPDCDLGGDLYYRVNGKCEGCPENLLFIYIGVGVAIVFLGFGAWYLNKKRVNLGIIPIGIDYAQVLAIFASTDVQWPNTVVRLYNAMSFFSFNINITAPECMFVMDYWSKWYVVMVLPLVLALGVFVLHYVLIALKKYVLGVKGKRAVRSHIHFMVRMLTSGMYYVYLFVVSMTLDVFNCKEIVSEDGVTDGLEYMSSAPEYVCWVEGEKQHDHFGFAFVFFLIYGVGYPLLICWILFGKNHYDKIRDDQLLRAIDTGASEKTNPNCYQFRIRYGELYYNYKPQFFFWKLCVLLRKFLIVVCALIFNDNATFQLTVVLMIMFWGYAMQQKYEPYMSTSERPEIVREFKEDIERVLADIETARARTEYGDRNMQKNKIKLNHNLSQKGISRKPVDVGQAAAYFFWNYNTVESVLLFCCVLVCLLGIMFESSYLNNTQFEVLGTFTVFIISASLFYYFIVVWTEIIGTLFPGAGCGWFVNGTVSEKEEEAEEEAGDQVKLDEFADFNMADISTQANPMAMGMDKLDGHRQMTVEEQADLKEEVERIQHEIAELKKKEKQLLLEEAKKPKLAVVKKKKKKMTSAATQSGKADDLGDELGMGDSLEPKTKRKSALGMMAAKIGGSTKKKKPTKFGQRELLEDDEGAL